MLKKTGILVIIFTSVFLGSIPFVQTQDSEMGVLYGPMASEGNQYEEVNININSDGDIYTHFYFENNELLPYFADVSGYISSYLPQVNSLGWVEWSIHYDESDSNHNSWIQFYFYTTDSNLAQKYAQWIMNFVMAFEVDQYSFDHSWGWEDHWDGYTEEHRYVTGVQYSGHIDWDGLKDTVESNIPRTNGGLSAQLDLSEIDHVVLRWELGGGSIFQRLGVRWRDEVDHLNGAHQFSLKDLLRVSTLEKQDGVYARTHISIDLPYVSGLWTSISENINIWSNHDQDWRNDWDMNNWYGIDFDLDNSRPSMTDFIVGFDYDFKPWEIQPREQASIDINVFGYMRKDMRIYYSNTTLHQDWPSEILESDNFNNLQVTYFPQPNKEDDPQSTIHMRYTLTKADENISLTDYFNNEGYYNDLIYGILNWSTYETENENLFNWIRNELGWVNATSFDQMRDWNWYDSWWHHDWDNNLAIPMMNYHLQFNHSYDAMNWNNLWETSDIYQESGMMQKSNIIDATYINENVYYHPNKGGYMVSQLNIEWNPLHRDILTPQKTYFGSTTHSFDFANLFGWSNIDHTDGFHETQLLINMPANTLEDRVVLDYPEQNGGYGFHTWDWNNPQWQDYPQQGVGMNIYTSDPWYGDDTNPYYFNSFNGDFEYSFHDDSEDLIPPNVHSIGYYDGSERWWDTSEALFNTTRFIVEARDDRTWGHNQWWDYWVYNTSGGNFPRFGQTYVDSVELSLEYQEFQQMGISDPRFTWGSYSMENITFAGTSNAWAYLLDTKDESLPDGTYIVHATATDSVGNTEHNEWQNMRIDNYNDSIYINAPELTFVGSTPTNNSKIEGIVPININVTDDIGLLSVLLQIGEDKDSGYGFFLNESIDPGLYNFDWDSVIDNFKENVDYWITVSAWDFEGHKTSIYYNLSVDNRKPGNPPTIDLISPLIIGDEVPILEGIYRFEANISDDNYPVIAVKLQIDDRIEFKMNASDTSEGLFFYEYDVSTLYNGTHTVTIKVIDNDEPQNSHSETFEFFANTTVDQYEMTDPPLWRNIYPGNFTSAEDILTSGFEINIEIFDDQGIESVNIKLSQVLDYSSANIPESVDGVDLTNIHTLRDTSMVRNHDGNNGWYTYYYDASRVFREISDGLMLCEIEIGDVGPVQNQVKVRMILFIINSSGADFNADPFAEIPGYSFEFLLVALGLTIGGLLSKFRKRK